MSDFFPPDEPKSINSTLPHSREAEEAVLGSVLINPEFYFDLSQKIKVSDFYIIRNQWIWEAFSTLIERRVGIDFLTVREMLQEKNHLDEVGGDSLSHHTDQSDTHVSACFGLRRNR